MIYYCSQMSDDDIKYICSVIHIADIRHYFTMHSKEFAKIRPGFRANKIKDSEARKILFLNRKNNFISSFLNNTIDCWIHQIEIALNTELNQSNKNNAYIKVLINSYFKDNVQLYFKLINSDESSEFIELLSESISLICEERKAIGTAQIDNDFADKRKYDKLIREIKKEHEKEIKKLNKNISIIEGKLNKTNDELEKTKNNLKNNNKQLEKEKSKNAEINKEIVNLKENNKRYKEKIEAIQKLQEANDKFLVFNSKDFTKAIKPSTYQDIEAFKEAFNYNLKSVLGDNYNKYSKYLSCYVERIVFSGIPIVIKRDFSDIMIKCIAGSIFGNEDYSILQYNCNMNYDNIIEYLEASNDIICFDNFLGNFNETVLLSICSHFKNKIIFFTYSYDRTLNHLSEDFYEYICYINLRQTSYNNLTNGFELSLETIMISNDSGYTPPYNENIYTRELKMILKELGFSESVISSKSRFVSDMSSLSAILFFDILPYYKNVLRKNPFLYSKKLKSCIEKTKFPSELKENIEDWFINE